MCSDLTSRLLVERSVQTVPTLLVHTQPHRIRSQFCEPFSTSAAPVCRPHPACVPVPRAPVGTLIEVQSRSVRRLFESPPHRASKAGAAPVHVSQEPGT